MKNDFGIGSFLTTLDSRYRGFTLRTDSDTDDAAELKKRTSSLKLALAQGRKLNANSTNNQHSIQLAILGPTQAGKSTLVNAITGSDLAGVSALAGYTVHAQGILINTDKEDPSTGNAIDMVFGNYDRVNKDALSTDNLKQYTLTTATEPNNSDLAPITVWDSPDFDSISATNYSEAVLVTAALADIIIFVVSKDKYADRSVWNLSLIHI